VLDTPNEPFFDSMAARLVRVFEVPMAFIAFIDGEREWFKSQVGLPEEIAEARYAPRALSICAHTVATNELLVVEDIARDKRFANKPAAEGTRHSLLCRRAAAGEQIPDRLYLPARHQTTAFLGRKPAPSSRHGRRGY
jgi:hypothetical protein